MFLPAPIFCFVRWLVALPAIALHSLMAKASKFFP
jgi:hypothetical protein